MHFLIIVIISWFKEAHLKSGTGICSSASSKRTGTLSLPSNYEKAQIFHTQQWYFLWQRKQYIYLGTFKWHTFYFCNFFTLNFPHIERKFIVKDFGLYPCYPWHPRPAFAYTWIIYMTQVWAVGSLTTRVIRHGDVIKIMSI